MSPRPRYSIDRVIRPALLAVAAALLSCGGLKEPTGGKPIKTLVVTWDAQSDKYKLVVGTIETLTNLRTMEGNAAHILGGAEIRIDYAEIAREHPKSQQELDDLTIISAPKPVDFAYFDVGGVLHPEDFHSLALATTYFNFEKAHLFFEAISSTLYQLPVHYLPKETILTGGSFSETTDNAAWDPIARTFSIYPFKELDGLPMGLNLGIIAHEYAHAVYSNRVFPKDEGVEWLYRKYFDEPEKWSPVVNLSRSLTEGMSDFFGAAVSGNPEFIKASIPSENDARRTDPPKARCITAVMKADLANTLHEDYDPYPLGAVIAAALWEGVSRHPDRLEAYSRGITDGMINVGFALVEHEDQTSLADVVEAMATTLPADLKPEACGLLLDRLALTSDAVPSCAEAVVPERKCR